MENNKNINNFKTTRCKRKDLFRVYFKIENDLIPFVCKNITLPLYDSDWSKTKIEFYNLEEENQINEFITNKLIPRKDSGESSSIELHVLDGNGNVIEQWDIVFINIDYIDFGEFNVNDTSPCITTMQVYTDSVRVIK